MLRLLKPPAVPKRAQAAVSPTGLALSAGAVTLATLVVASVALASTPGATPAHHHHVAQRVAAFPPDYTLPVTSLDLGKPTLSGDHGTVGVPKGTAPVPAVPNTKQVPAQSAAIAAYQGGSGSLTPAGIATLALRAGCSATNAVTATAISMAESGGSPSAQGDIALMDSTWDWSAGLWQIRGLRAQRGTGQLRDSIANQKAATNAAGMYVISSGCTSWGAWTTYTRGLYRSYLTVAAQAVNYNVRYFNAHGHHYPFVAAPDPNAPIPTGSGSGGGGGAHAAAKSSAAKPSTHSSAKAAPSAARGTTSAAKPSARRSTTSAKKTSAGPTPRKSTSAPTPKITLPTLPTLPPLIPLLPPVSVP